MVWDTGTFELLDGSYDGGRLDISSEGQKVERRMGSRQGAPGYEKQLVSAENRRCRKTTGFKKENASALTDRTMEEIASDKDAQWQSNRKGRSASVSAD